MIKILFFLDTTLASGGAEKALRELVNNMDQTKFDITVQTVWKEDADKFLVPGIQYRYFYKRKNIFNKLIFRLEAACGLSYWRHIKDNFDIEVAYLEHAPTKIIASSTNRKAVKLAWVHCDLMKIDLDLKRFQKKAGKWYKKFNAVVCVSQTVKESFDRLFGDRAKSVVVYNTIDDDAIRNKAKEPLPDEIEKKRFTIATVGRLYPVKGYDRLLEVLYRLRQEGKECDLWILGEGPERKHLEEYIAANNLQDAVSMPGFYTNPYPFLSAADLIVCSSVSEGFSTMVTEALILGKPIVTTDCSGMQELLGDSEYGLIVENSTDGIYIGIEMLLEDSSRLLNYAAMSKRRGENFSKEKLIRKTEKFLSGVCR